MSDTAKQLRKAAEAVGHKHGIYFVMMGAADELDGLTAINTQMREALVHIANKPLTDNPEASAEQCLEEAVRIASAAVKLADGEGE